MRIAVPIDEAAKLAGLSRTTIYRLFRSGQLTPRKAGNRTLILVNELERYLQSLPTAEAACCSPLGDKDNER